MASASTVYTREGLSSAVTALSDDWINVSTFIDMQLGSNRTHPVTEQIRFLKDLSACLSDPRHIDTLSAIAWDLVEPLLYYLRQEETRTCSEGLLDLVLAHGSKREVLLKLIEAAENIRLPDKTDSKGDLYLLTKLLEAQDFILKSVSTKRPSRFLAEFTKSILHAMKEIKSRGFATQELHRIWLVVLKSVKSTGIAHLRSVASKLPSSEQKTVLAVLKSFCTYIVELVPTTPAKPRCYAYFEESHQSLVLKRPVDHNEVAQTLIPNSAGSLETQLLDLCGFNVDEIETLFYCGDWAAAESQDIAEEQMSEVDLDEADIPFSPVGSVILLSEALRLSSSSARIDVSTPQRFLQTHSILMELCARTMPELATLDSCVHCASYVIAHQSSTSLQDIDDQDKLLFLQALSSICATCAHGQIRTAAHYAVRDMLKLMTDNFKLDFYLDTLEDCPFPSLKTATIGMIKDEVVEASSFWLAEARLIEITKHILIPEAEHSTAEDDALVSYWIQSASFAIVLMSTTLSSTCRSVVELWLQSLLARIAGNDSIPDSSLGVLEMHFASIRTLLPSYDA